MKTRRKLLLPLLLCFLSVANADKKCYSGCHGATGSLYKYEEGTNYKYTLEGTTISTVPGSSSGDVSKVSVTASVDISPQSQCGYVLKVSDITVAGIDGKTSSLKELEAHPVKFSFHDGHVESEICSEEGDSHNGLNIKRAVISLLQSAVHKDAGVTSHYETDVFGTCPTDFEFYKTGNTLKIKKTRNLNQCAHRENLNFPVFSTPYNINSEFQSSPLLISSLKVEQQIESGILKSATSEEKYQYQPHATVSSGLSVTVKTKLSFVSQAKGAAISVKAVKPESIIFELPHVSNEHSSIQAIQQALTKAEGSVEPAIQQSAAKDFADLVDILSFSKKSDILAVFQGVKSSDTAKKILLDALTRASTGDAVEVLSELVQNNELSKIQKDFWILSLGFIKHATKASLKAVLPILNNGPRQAYLGIGSLAGRYCSQHDCVNDAEFKEILNKLAEPIASGCKAESFAAENKIIASLKGLHNVHHLTSEVAEKIAQCAADKKVKTRIRVAALETFQSDASKDKLKSTAISILKNLDEDSEVRIKAYLALVECPCNKVADTVKNVLENEKVNQVGSFIVSHLRNLKASANPDKAAAKHYLGQILVTKKFPIDIRKYSFNQELSYSVDALNLGASGESNVIFSEKSYIPRSYSLNLTTQIFGHAFNLLEFNARAENLDYVLEKNFGPKGYFPTHDSKDIYEKFYKSAESIKKKIAEKYEETIRPKRDTSVRHPRDIHQQTSQFAKKVDLGVDSHDSDLDLDLSLKLYGSEVGWFTYHGSNKKFSPDDIINKVFDSVDDSFEKAKNLNFDYKKLTTFLDAEAVYPTGLGLPLKLSTKGSSAVRVKFDGNIDIPAIIKDPKNAFIKFQVVPSAAIELSGQLSFDTVVAESGVKVYGTVHTATGSDLSIRFLEGYGVDVKVGVPIKKQDIINFKSDIVTIVKENGQQKSQTPVKFDTKRQQYDGCFDQLNAVIGLTFCGDISYPFENQKLLSPAYGPTNVALSIEKEDDSLTSYHFKAYYNTKEAHQRSLEFILDTPNSKPDRKISLVISGGTKPKFISAAFKSPFKSASFDGHITDTDKEQSISAKFLDDSTEYSAKIGVFVSGDANHKVLKPHLEYKVPEFKTKETGLIGVKGGKGKSQKAVAVSGVIKLDKESDTSRKYTLEGVTISIPNKEYKIDGTIAHTPNQLETDLKVTYEKESFSVKSNLQKDVTDAQKKLKVYLETVFSEAPDINFVLNWEFNKEQNSFGNVLTLVHGSDPKSEQHKISVNQYLLYQYENVRSFDYKTKNSLKYPLVSLSGTLNGDVTPKSANYELEGTYEKYHVSSSLQSSYSDAKPGDYNVNFKAQVMDNSLDFHAKREIVGEAKSKFTNSLEIKPGGKYQLNALVTHNFQKDNFHNQIHAEAKFPTEPKNLKVDAGIKNNKKEFSSNFEVVAGDKKFVEFNANLQKDHSSGSFKAALPPNFESSGNYKFEGGKGVGSFVIDFPKQERKIEGKSELTQSGTKYVGFADICWDVLKNPKKSLRIETNSDFAKNNIDTQNTIIYKGEHKTQLIYKGKRVSEATEESYASEAQLILPSGRQFVSAYSGKCFHQTDDYNGEIDFQFTDFSAPGVFSHKIGFKLNAKNVNPSKKSFDGQADLTYNNANGKDAHFQAALKKILTGERWTISAHSSASGSLIESPVNIKLDSEVSEQFLKCRLAPDNTLPFGTYTLVATAGDVSINGNGKINQNVINNEIDFKFPADYSITTLKWASNNHYTPNQKIKTSNVFNWNGDKFFKVSTEGTKEETGVTGKLEWESHLKSPRTVTGYAHYKPTADGDKNIDAALNFAYEGKSAEVILKADYDKKSETIQVQLNGNLPEQGKFDVTVKNKVISSLKGFQTDVVLLVNDKKISVTNQVVLDKENPLIDLVAEHPQGKSRVFFKIEKKGERHYVGESKVKWVGNGGGNLAVDGEAKLDSVEDFFIKINADSPKLNIEKYHVEIANKPGKTGKKITFSAKSNENVIFAGSTSYNFKDEGSSKIIDGAGNIKVGDKSHSLNFKYVHQALTEADGGEDGNQVKLNVKYGKNSYDLFGKLTATTFLVRRTFTKETGEVTKSEISSKIKKYSVAEYDYEFNVLLDLSKIFKDTEDLSLKIVTKRNGFILDHNFELQRNPESKIKYQLYVHENQAGAVLTLPKRVVAVEAKYDVPKNKKIINVEAALWLNKQKAPTEKTSIAVHADVNKIGEGGSFQGEIRATHPALGKDLVIKGEATVLQQWNKIIDSKVELDIFAKKEQKINVEYKSSRSKDNEKYSFQEHFFIKGSNIDIDYKQNFVGAKTNFNYGLTVSYVDANKVKREKKIVFEVTPSKIVYLFKIPEANVISFNAKIKDSPNHYSINSEFELFGEKYEEKLDIKNQNNLQYAFIFDKGGKEKKFTGDFSVVIGQSAEFSTTFDNKQLGYIQVALDDGNFLKSKYKYSTESFKGLIEAIKDDYITFIKRSNKVAQEAVDRLSKDIVQQVDVIQKSLPNFAPVVQAYTDQITALREEVVNEKSIQEAADYIKGTLSVVLEQVVVVLEEIAKTTESLLVLFNEATAKFSEAIKKLAPQVTAGYEKIAKVLVKLFEDSLKFSVEVINVVLDKIKEHEEEIQVIVTALTEFFSEVGQLAVKTFVQVKAQLKDFVEVFIEQVKALPIYAVIQEKIEEFKKFEIPEQSWKDYHDFVASVKDILPTTELSQFFESVAKTIEKVFKHQQITGDDFKALYKELIAAIKSVLNYVQQHVPQDKLVKPSYVPLPVFTLFKIPKGALRFSPFAWLQSPDLPSVSDVYYTYRPTLNPLDYIPPYKANAYLVSSTELFTFDQRHITFNGNCLYILAQDFVDGNFSIAAKIENGKVQAIIVADKKDSVELDSDGTVKVNGAASEFPVNHGDLNAWRRYPTSNIYSKSGVRVHCSTDLEFCSFHVSGFYFGKTRGLLGTINNEQYNDLALPNGKIAPSVTEFVNAYKLGSCGDIAAPATTQEQQNSYCTGFFSSESSLKSCFSFVNPHCYRHACNLVTATASDKKAAACKVATGYHSACENSGSKVYLPNECIQCSYDGKTVEADESVTVKVPQKKADIVLVVEQSAENEEVFKSLVTPLIGQLTKDLSTQGISDVHFSLIGYGAPDMKWPQHYTTNGKIDFNGKSSIYFSKKAAPEEKDNYYKKFKDLKHKIDVELGFTTLSLAFKEAASYPFRPDAVKAVIGVTGGDCEKSPLPISLQHVRQGLLLFFHKTTGIHFHLISNVKNLHYTDKAAKQEVSNIVGFSKKEVLTVGSAKGSSNISPSSITYDADSCIAATEFIGGTVFNSDNFVNAKADAKKQFLHIVSGSLAESFAESQYTLDAKCVQKDGLPRFKFEVTESNEKEILQKHGVKG